MSVFVQLHYSSLLVRFAHYTSAHHIMYFPPCGTLKTSSLNFFYSSSSFQFLFYIYEPFSVVPSFPKHPAPFLIFSLTLFMSFLKLENKSWRTSFTPRPIVILRHCSVLPEKQYIRTILYTLNVWAYIRTISLKLTRIHTHTHMEIRTRALQTMSIITVYVYAINNMDDVGMRREEIIIVIIFAIFYEKRTLEIETKA